MAKRKLTKNANKTPSTTKRANKKNTCNSQTITRLVFRSRPFVFVVRARRATRDEYKLEYGRNCYRFLWIELMIEGDEKNSYTHRVASAICLQQLLRFFCCCCCSQKLNTRARSLVLSLSLHRSQISDCSMRTRKLHRCSQDTQTHMCSTCVADALRLE